MSARKSSRIQSRPIIEYQESTPSYPDGPPLDSYEACVAKLDKECFPSHIFARVDNILMGAFFKTKRRFKSYRSLNPATAFAGQDILASAGQLLSIAQIICLATKKPFSFSQEGVYQTYRKVLAGIPGLFSAEEEPVLLQ
jgi:hypothetical protein